MGLKNLIKNFPRVMKQKSWRASLVRGMVGQPAKDKNEAMLHDTVDLIPIVGDVPNLIRMFTNKGNRMEQAKDFFVGAIPIVGDIADFFLTSDTNLQQFEKREQKMGKTETALSGKFIPNLLEKYAGGVDRKVWED